MTTTVPDSVKAPAAPQVNLIPPEVESRRAKGRSRALIIVAFVMFIVLLVALVGFTELQARSAEDRLALENAKTQALNDEIALYDHVPVIQAELLNAKSARLYLGGTEILMSDLITGLTRAMPESVSLQGLTWLPTTPFVVAGQEAGPFSAPDIGVLSFSGRSLEYPNIADLEEALNSVPGLARTTIPGAARQVEEDEYYTFSGSVRITAVALSGRFSDAWNEREIYREAIVEASEEVELATVSVATAAAILTAAIEADQGVAEAQATLAVAETVLAAAAEALQDAEDALIQFTEAKAAEAVAALAGGGVAPEPSPSPSANEEASA